MQQNEKDWYEWRLEGIGASDAPIIMGKSKFKTKLQLWDEKFNKTLPTEEEQKKKEFITNKGHRLEAWARPGIEFKTGLSFKPATFTHNTYDFIRASLDGWNIDTVTIWECKFMGQQMFDILSNESLSLSERIPVEYFDQLMQQFFVTGAKRLFLTGIIEEVLNKERRKQQKENGEEQDKRQVNLIQYTLEIPRLSEFDFYINRTLAPNLFAFWKSVQDGNRPEIGQADKLEVNDDELKGMVQTYGSLVSQLKSLEEKAKKNKSEILGDIPTKISELKEKIFNHPSRVHEKMEFDDYKLTEVKGKELVNYKDALSAFFDWIKSIKTLSPGEIVQAIQSFPDEPSLEKYTSIGKPSFKITPPKKEQKENVKAISSKEVTTVTMGDITQTTTEEKSSTKVGLVEKNISRTETVTEKRNEWANLSPDQQSVVAKSNSFKNPETGKKPRGWDGKSRAERIEYLEKSAKKASEVGAKHMLELANELKGLDEADS